MLKKTMSLMAGIVLSCSILLAAVSLAPVQSTLKQSEELLQVRLKTGNLSAADKKSVTTLLTRLKAKDGFSVAFAGNAECIFYSGEDESSYVEFLEKDQEFIRNIRKNHEKCRDLYLPQSFKGKAMSEGEVYVGKNASVRPVIYGLYFAFADKKQMSAVIDEKGNVQVQEITKNNRISADKILKHFSRMQTGNKASTRNYFGKCPDCGQMTTIIECGPRKQCALCSYWWFDYTGSY